VSKKEEILRGAEKFRRKEAERLKLRQWDEAPSKMRSDRMPLGCFLWILAGIALCVYLFIKNN
jgi:hypothetical protein